MTARSETIAIDIDDEQMSGTFLSPKSKVPGVLFVHGWGGSQERDLERAKGIAGLGCVCLTFDLRGHAGNGIPLSRATRKGSWRYAKVNGRGRRLRGGLSFFSVFENIAGLAVQSFADRLHC